jgi:tight adherence protein C
MLAGSLIPVIWFFLLAFAACATLYFAFDRGQRPVERRIQDLAVKFRITDGQYDEQTFAGHGVASTLMAWAQRRLPAPNQDKPAVEKLVQTLQHAGFYNPAAPKLFQGLRLLAALVLGLIAYLAAVLLDASATLFVLFGMFLGYLAPLYYLRAMARGRQRRIRRELPDIIDLLVVCVECGLGLLASIRIVGRESERHGRLMGAQMAQLSAELSAGSSLGDGLRALAQRTGVEDIKTFAAILIQSEKLGTEMAQALRAIADQLRVRRAKQAEEMAQKLPIKMIIPLVAFLLPAMMLILVGPAMIQIFRSFNFQ